jgi:hypothetical protein
MKLARTRSDPSARAPRFADHFADGEDWSTRRRLPRGSDAALTGTARHWLRRLPPGRRPYRLCELYPRVANRIAWCWSDVAMAAQVLDDLLVDRRGGRQGFARPIVRELQRLQQFNEAQRIERDAEGLWTRLGRIVAWR